MYDLPPQSGVQLKLGQSARAQAPISKREISLSNKEVVVLRQLATPSDGGGHRFHERIDTQHKK